MMLALEYLVQTQHNQHKHYTRLIPMKEFHNVPIYDVIYANMKDTFPLVTPFDIRKQLIIHGLPIVNETEIHLQDYFTPEQRKEMEDLQNLIKVKGPAKIRQTKRTKQAKKSTKQKSSKKYDEESEITFSDLSFSDSDSSAKHSEQSTQQMNNEPSDEEKVILAQFTHKDENRTHKKRRSSKHSRKHHTKENSSIHHHSHKSKKESTDSTAIPTGYSSSLMTSVRAISREDNKSAQENINNQKKSRLIHHETNDSDSEQAIADKNSTADLDEETKKTLDKLNDARANPQASQLGAFQDDVLDNLDDLFQE